MDWFRRLAAVPRDARPRGAWSSDDDDVDADPSVETFRARLPAYLAAIDPQHPIVFVTSGSSCSALASVLRCAGVFDRRFVVPAPTLEERGRRFVEQLGETRCSDSLRLAPGKVGKLLDSDFDNARRQGLVVVAMQRLATREQRHT